MFLLSTELGTIFGFSDIEEVEMTFNIAVSVYEPLKKRMFFSTILWTTR